MADPLPVRTSADPNTALDINTLSSAVGDMISGATGFDQVTFNDTTATAGIHTESGVLKYKTATIATGAGGISERLFPFYFRGPAYSQVRIAEFSAGFTGMSLSNVYAFSATAPANQPIQIDINKNGVSMLNTTVEIDVASTQDDGNYGIKTDGTQTINSERDRVSIDIDQVGTGTTGGDPLEVTLVFTP